MTFAMTFLDEEFLAGWPPAAAALGDISATVALKTSGGPNGKAAASLVFESGQMVTASAGAVKDADVTLEAPWQLAADVFCGEADPAAGYMSGDLKVSGDMAIWLALLKTWRSVGSLRLS